MRRELNEERNEAWYLVESSRFRKQHEGKDSDVNGKKDTKRGIKASILNGVNKAAMRRRGKAKIRENSVVASLKDENKEHERFGLRITGRAK